MPSDLEPDSILLLRDSDSLHTDLKSIRKSDGIFIIKFNEERQIFQSGIFRQRSRTRFLRRHQPSMMKKHQKGGRKWQEKLEEANLLNKFKDTIRFSCMISHTLNLDKCLFPTINFLHLPPPSLITRVGIHLLQSKFTFVLIFHEGNISLLSRFIFFFKL